MSGRMKSILEGALILGAVTVLLVWAGEGRFPSPGDGERAWHVFHRGHKPASVEHTGDNLDIDVRPGTYPPRALGLSGQRKPASTSWLLDADSYRDRFERLEAVLGFDESMHQIGERFVAMHRAIRGSHAALALFEWQRASRAADVARLKRPPGDPVERWLESGPWSQLGRALEAGDLARAKQHYEAVRSDCMQCHEATGHGFLRDDVVLTSTATWD